MTKFLPCLITLSVAALALGGCITLDQPKPTVAPAKDVALDRFVSARRASARKLESGGRVAAALVEWRYVAAAVPNDGTAPREIARLERIVDTRSSAYLRRADAAWRKNQRRKARILYLKVLALDRDNRRALRRLRAFERATVLAGQARKDEGALAEYRARLSRRPAAKSVRSASTARASAGFEPNANRKARKRANQRRETSRKGRTGAHGQMRTKIALAQQSRRNGDLRGALKHLDAVAGLPDAENAGVIKMAAGLRKEIAARLYANGLKQMNLNLDRAVELFTEALQFDPKHHGAHRRLAQAKNMRDRLKAIK